VPLSNFAPRGFGFVHHSIAILDHEVPNLSITISPLLHRSTAAKASVVPAGAQLGAGEKLDGDAAVRSERVPTTAAESSSSVTNWWSAPLPSVRAAT
jgi:hypothetical protein